MNVFINIKRPRYGIIVTILLIIILVFTLLWRNRNVQYFDLSAFDFDKYHYALYMDFDVYLIVEGQTYNTFGTIYQRVFGRNSTVRASQLTEQIKLEILLVHNKPELNCFPENVIIAWPRAEVLFNGLTLGETVVDSLNWAAGVSVHEPTLNFGLVRRNDVSIEDFGLTYPLYVSDLVDNWEDVFALWSFLKVAEQDGMNLWGSIKSIPRDKRAFASPIGFDFNFLFVVDGNARVGSNVMDRNMFEPWQVEFCAFYDTLIFVRNEDEAHGFPSNVVVAWPVDGCTELHRRLEQVNWEVNRDSNSIAFGGINLFPNRRTLLGVGLEKHFGLTYPITVDDLVYNWEQVFDLIMYLELGW